MAVIDENSVNDFMSLGYGTVLDGPITGDIWTGLPDIKYFKDKYLSVIFGKDLSDEIVRKYNEVLDLIKKARSTRFDGKTGADVKEKSVITDKVFSIMKDLSKVPDDYTVILDVLYVRTFEDICENNPKEVKKIDKRSKRAIEFLKDDINDDIAYRVYDEDLETFRPKGQWTLETEKKVIKKRNKDKYVELIAPFIGNDKNTNTADKSYDFLNATVDFEELAQLFDKESFGKAAVNAIQANFLLEKGLTADKIENIKTEDFYDTLKDNGYYDIDLLDRGRLITKFIKDNIDYINLDRLFLLYSAKTIDTLQGRHTPELIDRIEKGEVKTDECLSFMPQAKEILQTLVDNRSVNSRAKVKLIYDNSEDEYDLSTIKKTLAKFKGNLYLSKESNDMFKDLLYLDDKCLWSKDDALKEIDLTKLDKEILGTTNLKNLEAFLKNDLLSKDDIKDILTNLDDLNDEDVEKEIDSLNLDAKYKEEVKSKRHKQDRLSIIKDLSQNENFDEEDLRELYDKELIKFDDLDSIPNSNEIGNTVSDEEMVEAYRKYTNCYLKLKQKDIKENEDALNEAKKEKDGVLALYKKYKLNGLSKKDKIEKSEDLIWDYFLGLGKNENVDQKMLITLSEMYNDRTALFESIRNFDKDYLNSFLIDVMLKKGELSLEDTEKVKNMLSDGEKEDMLDSVVNDTSIDIDKKFTLIMNMFYENTEEDTNLRLKYLDKLGFKDLADELRYSLPNMEDEKGVKKDSDEDNLNKDDLNKNDDTNMYVYPDNIKWLLFKQIDKGASVHVHENGYVEFYLPKFDSRVIEKFYNVDKKYNIVGQTYGEATCIISDATYRKESDKFVGMTSNGRTSIYSKNMREIVPREDRVNHVTHSENENWMRGLVKKLGIDLNSDERYTKEELKELKDALKENENKFMELEK